MILYTCGSLFQMAIKKFTHDVHSPRPQMIQIADDNPDDSQVTTLTTDPKWNLLRLHYLTIIYCRLNENRIEQIILNTRTVNSDDIISIQFQIPSHTTASHTIRMTLDDHGPTNTRTLDDSIKWQFTDVKTTLSCDNPGDNVDLQDNYPTWYT
jgi:hypothetical protein